MHNNNTFKENQTTLHLQSKPKFVGYYKSSTWMREGIPFLGLFSKSFTNFDLGTNVQMAQIKKDR